MSIWKSPVFYFGIILTLAVIAALAAPFVIDWNRYRADLENFGQKLTGRQVHINGPIAVRLFPWPRLEANDVHLANPDGKAGDLLTAAQVSVKVNLAGLTSGTIRVDEIELHSPTVTLIRDVVGAENWHLAPSVNLRKSALLDDVKLEKINVTNATLRLVDDAKPFTTEFTAITADLSAPAITGPWKAKGDLHFGTLPVGFTFGSTEILAGQDSKIGLKLTTENIAYPDFSFDGALVGAGGVKGHILLSPHVAANEKGDQEGEFRPLTMQAEVDANYDVAKLTAIKITPADVKDSSTLIEGETTLDFTNGLAAKSVLKAPRLNLDTLLGAQSLEAWRVGGVAGFLNTLMQNFPEKLTLDLQFDASVLTLARQTLDQVTLSVEAARNAVRVRRFSSNLPGQSQILFNGIVFPGEQQAELGGSVAFESPDLRTFSQWVLPSEAANFKTIWTGDRGHLKLQSDVSLTEQRLGLQNLKYELDGFGGDAEMVYRLGALPSIDLRINATNLDVDSFLKGGITALPTAAALSWVDIIKALVQGGGTAEKRLTVQANALTLNGVQAQDVAIDVSSGLAGLDIKTIDIGSVAGAHLSASGQILNGSNGPLGDVTAKITATDPIGVLMLAGITPPDLRPRWTMALGATDITLKALVSEGANEPRIRIVADGSSGPFTVSGSGTIDQPSQGRDSQLNFDTAVSSRDGSALVRALGMPITDGAPVQEGRIMLTGQGKLSKGLQSKISLNALGTVADFDGTLGFTNEGAPTMSGPATIESAEAGALLRSLGVPMSAANTGALQLSANVDQTSTKTDITKISGNLAGQSFAGELKIEMSKSFAGDFEVAKMSLANLLSVGFLSWQGKPASMDTPFTVAKPFGLDGEIWIRPHLLALYGEAAVSEAVAGFQFDAQGRRMSLAGKTGNAEKLLLDVALAPKAGFYELQTSGTMSIAPEEFLTSPELGPQLAGRSTLTWKAKGTGLSAFAALSDIEGDGVLTAPKLALVKIAPQDFATAVPQVKTAEDLSNAIGKFENGTGYELGEVILPFAATSGVVRAQPLTRALPNGTASIALSADLPSSEITMFTKVDFSADQQLPPASVVVSGAPGAVARRSLSSDLASKLGYEILARDLAELERVQKQQQELIAKEELQRQDDEAKFEAYQAQKAELRTRLREQKIFASQRARDQAAHKAALDFLLAAEPSLTNTELTRRRRELKVLETIRSEVLLPQAPVLPAPLQLPQ
jgi:AsmA family